MSTLFKINRPWGEGQGKGVYEEVILGQFVAVKEGVAYFYGSEKTESLTRIIAPGEWIDMTITPIMEPQKGGRDGGEAPN